MHLIVNADTLKEVHLIYV